MSFRMRALALIMFLTVAATGATAWLTLRQVSRQVQQSVVSGQEAIIEALRSYGANHGTWEGLPDNVGTLAQRSGQRIRVETGTGTLLADSDVLAGRTARRTVGVPVTVDVRPVLRLRPDSFPNSAIKVASTAVGQYRVGIDYAICLTRAGIPVTAKPDDLGIPVFTPGGATSCRLGDLGADARADNDAMRGCAGQSGNALVACLAGVFTQRTNGFAPAPVLVYLGAVDQISPPLRIWPTVAVALTVATAGILGALLLSRGVLRPVSALTRASRRLGAGDFAHRVPASGRDEIAELARSFNRMADSLQESEARQQRLTGDVAHELRTPLANLRGYLEALRDGVLEATPEVLASLHEEVLLQQRIVDDLQDLALAEAGALTYHRAVVDLGELLTTCVTAHRPLAEEATVSLTMTLTVTAGVAPVHGDPDRMRQLFGNLISNACRAASPGGRVELTLSRTGEEAVVDVRDTGHGIAPTDLPHVFDRFWRADAARGRRTGGSGLGLAIVRQIVTDHGGTIAVTSRVGEGTVFTVRLPLFIATVRVTV